jgi:selenocysteine lyase/cysteine desulfurase
MSINPSRSKTDPLLALRREFEIPRNVVFLNHAAFGPIPRRGRIAVEELIQRQGFLRGDPNVDNESYAMLAELRSMFGRLAGQDRHRVGFVPNASYGLNAILWGMDLKPGETILVPAKEFPALVYAVRALAGRIGANVRAIPCPDGCITLEALEKELQRGAAVCAISWVQYFNGYRYDLRAVTELCHRHGCVVAVDGSQGVGAIPMNMKRDGFDALACGTQKWLFGQTGAGFMAIAPDPLRAIRPPQSGWLSYDWGYKFGDLQRWDRPQYPDGRAWEVGTYPYFSVRLAHAGLSILTECGTARIFRHLQGLHRRLIEGLAGSSYRPLQFTDPKNRSGIITIAGPQAAQLHHHLYSHRVYTSLREGNIRVSPHFYNTDAHIDRLVREIREFEHKRPKRSGK